jgi:hypothetical protein
MNNHLLMLTKEPTDKQLKELMNAVGREVREKASLAQKNMNEKILQEITLLQERMR